MPADSTSAPLKGCSCQERRSEGGASRINANLVIQDAVARGLPFKIEVRVLCHVQRRGRIGGGFEIYVQYIVVCEAVRHARIDSPREPLAAPPETLSTQQTLNCILASSPAVFTPWEALAVHL